jgi:hypothetical protein
MYKKFVQIYATKLSYPKTLRPQDGEPQIKIVTWSLVLSLTATIFPIAFDRTARP